MKIVTAIVLFVLALSVCAFAQTSPEIDKALLAAPAPQKDAATVIKWKADFTYDTVKKGTNKLVCYERPIAPGSAQVFSVECTSLTNLERVAQSLKTETIVDPMQRRAAFEALEKDGKWIKPEYGSVFYNMTGTSQATARLHATSLRSWRDEGDNGSAGKRKRWRRLDHECRNVRGSSDDARPLSSHSMAGVRPVVLGVLIAVAVIPAQGTRSFTGTITDGMCPAGNHSQMRMGPTDAECAIACNDGHGAPYVLYDGKDTYTLSDQKAPAKFAGKKVTVTGTFDAKSKTIRVTSIAAAK